MREAPSLVIIEALLAAGARIQANDPAAIESTQRILGDRIEYFAKPMDALRGADALIVATEWNEYRTPSFKLLKDELSDAVIFDGRNIYERDRVEAKG